MASLYPNVETGTIDEKTKNSTNGNSVVKKKPKKDDDKKKRINMEMIVILTVLLLQDGPLFCLRMTLIFK